VQLIAIKYSNKLTALLNTLFVYQTAFERPAFICCLVARWAQLRHLAVSTDHMTSRGGLGCASGVWITG